MSIPEYIQAFIQLAKQMDEEHGELLDNDNSTYRR